MKDRPVPYSLVGKVEKEYDWLVQSDILYPVSSSKWASPVVRVPKSDGSIRVCRDYKAINECIDDDVYKLPNVQDMFAMLSQDGTNPEPWVLSTNYFWMKGQLSYSPSLRAARSIFVHAPEILNFHGDTHKLGSSNYKAIVLNFAFCQFIFQ